MESVYKVGESDDTIKTAAAGGFPDHGRIVWWSEARIYVRNKGTMDILINYTGDVWQKEKKRQNPILVAAILL